MYETGAFDSNNLIRRVCRRMKEGARRLQTLLVESLKQRRRGARHVVLREVSLSARRVAERR